MRHPQTRIPRLAIPLLIFVLACCMVGPRRTAQAGDSTISFSVINGRTGLIHITATGLPPNLPVEIDVYGKTIAYPPQVMEYISVTTSDDGTIDQNDNVDAFICGTYLQLILYSLKPHYGIYSGTGKPIAVAGDILAQSPVILGSCPVTTPAIAITALANGAAQINGAGFYPKEPVAITLTPVLAGAVTGGMVQADETGVFSATLPLGTIACGDTITPQAVGQAGSIASGVPAIYSCPTPTATPPTGSSAAGAAQAATGSRSAHLLSENTPAVIGYHQLEIVRVSTGVPRALITAAFAGSGVRPVQFTRRADSAGNARMSYMAVVRVPAGKRLSVRYTITYRAGGRIYRTGGMFSIAGRA